MAEQNPAEQIEVSKQPDGKVNIVMDMSMFDLFETCAARYNYRYMMNKGPANARKSTALDIGSLMHEGMEVYFKGIQSGIHFNDRIHAGLQKLRSVACDPDASNLEPEELSLVESTFEQNCDYWRFEDEHLVIHEVEQAFAYVLHEDEIVRIIIQGKIDLLVDRPGHGNQSSYYNLPYDHKTYSRDSEVSRLSNQFMNYARAVGSNYLVVNRIGLQTSLKPEEKFKRIMLSYDPIILDDWRNNLTRVILDHYLVCLATEYWPTDFTNCFKFNRKCEFYEICDSSGKEAKLFKLNSEFVGISPWDVTAKFTKNK